MKSYAFLFDLDGTLVDSLADICNVLNDVRHSRGLTPWPFEQIRPFIGKGADYLIRNCFPELLAEEHAAALDLYREIYLRNPERGGGLYPGVAETLARLRSNPNALVGVVTNKPGGVAEVTLAHYLPDFTFDLILGPEKVSAKKPNPHHLLEALEQLKVRPERALFVGDTDVDHECAVGAGVKFLAASFGFGGVEVSPPFRLLKFDDLLKHLPADFE